MNNCQEARNAVTILETACPRCGEIVEVFVKAGQVYGDAACGCGGVIAEGTPAESLPCF